MSNESKSIRAAGGYGNLVLYRMCAENPLHIERRTGLEIVHGKARMIAKVYEVSRNLGKDYDLIAQVLCSEKLALDRALDELGGKSLRSECIPEIVKLHGKVDRLLCEELVKVAKGRKVHSRASFVSKYLHFHCPNTFPILDSLAETAIKRRLGRRLPVAEFTGKNASGRYERICRAILDLQYHGDFAGMSLREVDNILVPEGRALREEHRSRKIGNL